MRYSRKTLKVLTEQYKAVLKKCFMLNAVAVMGITLSQPVLASTDTSTPTLGNNSGYTLTEVDSAGTNTITKYTYSVDATTHALTLNPVYYTIALRKTAYGDSAQSTTKTFKFYKDANGFLKLAESTGGQPELGSLTYKYSEDNKAFSRINNPTDYNYGPVEYDFIGFSDSSVTQGGAFYSKGFSNSDIRGDFIGNSVKDTNNSAYGGAIYNEANTYDATIGEIESDFIGNYATSINSNAYGGAIYNEATDDHKAVIGDITGDFIGNFASGTKDAEGGAIYNKGHNSYYDAKINDITGDFIGNHATSTDISARGGAVYNASYAKINKITGSFIANYVESKDFTSNEESQGGAIYNRGSFAKIGDITGDFIENYASGGKRAYGGAIFNSYTSTIGNIMGDFIKNYATNTNGEAQGGAIYNGDFTAQPEIGNITGDFIENYASGKTKAQGGAIYNYKGTITSFKSDFIGNYATSAGSSAQGGAIYNTQISAEIGNITGDFIGNYANSMTSYVYGGAIYNDSASKIGNITGDFIKNNVKSTENSVRGGAIYNYGENTTIGEIESDFIANSANGKNYGEGGAILSAIMQKVQLALHKVGRFIIRGGKLTFPRLIQRGFFFPITILY